MHIHHIDLQETQIERGQQNIMLIKNYYHGKHLQLFNTILSILNKNSFLSCYFTK